MADLLKVRAGIRHTPTLSTQHITDSGLIEITVSMSGDKMIHQIQEVGTTEEYLAVGDVTPGFLLIRNLDPTNYVELNTGASPANYTVKVKAGEIALFRMAYTAIKIIANTAACDVEFWLFED